MPRQIIEIIMPLGKSIRDEKLQWNTTKKVAKMLALLTVKTDNYEYLTDKVVLCSDQDTKGRN